MSGGTGLPAGSVVLLHTVKDPFPTAYQRDNSQPGQWFGVRDWWRDDVMAEFIGEGRAEVVHYAPDKDEALAKFLWEAFEKDPWEEASNITRSLQQELAKRTREYVLKQEEDAL